MHKAATKRCMICGCVMEEVSPNRKFCRYCAMSKRRSSHKVRKALGPYKSIEQCAKEATDLGMSYGEYCAKGLDKRWI